MLDAEPVVGSGYGKPNVPLQLTNVDCTGNEEMLGACQSTPVTPDESLTTDRSFDAAGVKCVLDPTTSTVLGVISNNPATAVMIVLIVLLIISVLITIRYCIVTVNFFIFTV